MDSRIRRTRRDYTMTFELAVVDQVEKADLTYKQARERYGIQGNPSPSTTASVHICRYN